MGNKISKRSSLMIENIKNLYGQINQKTKFIGEVAADLGKNPQYVRSHWFSSFWTIPEIYQGRVVELLQNKIKAQNQITNTIQVTAQKL